MNKQRISESKMPTSPRQLAWAVKRAQLDSLTIALQLAAGQQASTPPKETFRSARTKAILHNRAQGLWGIGSAR